MKIFLEKAIFINRAPFDNLQLDFSENEIAVLSATNGRGKTTILSHIVDAFYEMARPNFPQEFAGKESKYYRISSAIYNLDSSLPSFVYFRFQVAGKVIDYVDIRNQCNEEQYNKYILLENKITFNEISEALNQSGNVKKISSIFNGEMTRNTFQNNLLTYFPAYRYESPGYLNDVYKMEPSFKKESGYSGSLSNPLEVSSGLHQLANWVMDIVLDLRIANDPSAHKMLSHLNEVISKTLISKKLNNIGFGVGARGMGGTRLQIGSQEAGSFKQIYPSIFNLSSGELSVFCLFGELLRQVDNIRKGVDFNDIAGIVLIDEVDKHLHIKLQNEVLPKLFQLFPNVQFIISSHSPFLCMGLAEQAQERSKIIDLDNFGISKDPTTNELYNEVYKMMIKDNDRFKEMYKSLEDINEHNAAPLILTEGKTDWKYFIRALKYFHQKDEFLNLNSTLFLKFGSEFDVIEKICGTDTELEMGDCDLEKYLSALILIREKESENPSPIRIGIFDSDKNSIKIVDKSKNKFGVHSFKISPEGISTEFLFSDTEIKHEVNGRRLYVGSEFNSKTKKLDSEKSINLGGDSQNSNKAGKNVIIESDVYDNDGKNIALSKELFAQSVFNDVITISDESWETFRHIFEKISEIIPV